MERLYIQNDDGTEREVTDEAERDAVMAAIHAGTVLSGVASVPGTKDQKRTVFNASAKTAREAEIVAFQAAQDERESRTVVVTVNDGILPPTEEHIELQVVADAASKAGVNTRMIAGQGIGNPSHVIVETLAEFKARQP